MPVCVKLTSSDEEDANFGLEPITSSDEEDEEKEEVGSETPYDIGELGFYDDTDGLGKYCNLPQMEGLVCEHGYPRVVGSERKWL